MVYMYTHHSQEGDMRIRCEWCDGPLPTPEERAEGLCWACEQEQYDAPKCDRCGDRFPSWEAYEESDGLCRACGTELERRAAELGSDGIVEWEW